MSIETEFPDFDLTTLPSIPPGFIDTSWHNDTCPSFENETLSLKLWIEYPDSADREMGLKAERFVLSAIDADGSHTDIVRTDSWTMILLNVSLKQLL